MEASTQTSPTATQDTFPINGTDYVEFYVGNAKQSAIYYQATFGFQLIAYRGPETGHRDTVSYVLQQDKVRFTLTSALRPNHPVAEHVAAHGDGVKVLALWVDDARGAYEAAMARGAESAFEPYNDSDADGEVVLAGIRTYGETVHVLVQRSAYHGVFLPGYEARTSPFPIRPVGLKYIDHCVGNVELGAMNRWVKFYQDVLGFQLLITFDDKDISTEYTALMSKVVSNGNGYIKFPINEPAKGLKKSQIEEYLEFYRGAGVQHIALATDDILFTVDTLRKRGVDFLYVPDTYYEDVLDRVGDIDEDIEDSEATEHSGRPG